jgi:hypothetical protein
MIPITLHLVSQESSKRAIASSATWFAQTFRPKDGETRSNDAKNFNTSVEVLDSVLQGSPYISPWVNVYSLLHRKTRPLISRSHDCTSNSTVKTPQPSSPGIVWISSLANKIDRNIVRHLSTNARYLHLT